jgi:hypothetical protein
VARWGVLRRETMRSIGNLLTGIGFSLLVSTLTLFAISVGYLCLILCALPHVAREFGGPVADTVTTVVEVSKGVCSAAEPACVRETTTTITPPTLLGRVRHNAELLTVAIVGSGQEEESGRRPWRLLALAALCGAAAIVVVFVATTRGRYFENDPLPDAKPTAGESAEDWFERGLLWVVAGIVAFVVLATTIVVPLVFPLEGKQQPAALLLPFATAAGARVTAGLIGVVFLPHMRLWTRRTRSFWGSVQAITMYGGWTLLLFGLLPLAIFAVRDNTEGIGWSALGSLIFTRLLASRGGASERRFSLPPELRNGLLGVAVTLVLLLGLIFFAGLTSRIESGGTIALILGVSAGVLLLLALVVNQNRTSPHYFYRDRLAETYLRSELPDAERRQRLFRDAMEMPLSSLHGEPAPSPTVRWCNPSPYHLISAAINLAGSRDLTRKDRKSGYWLFSKLYCGSIHTGFRGTARYRGNDTKLAGAVAISGAAASSGMGRGTFFALAFATVLFNLRLGHWIENPKYRTSITGREGSLRHPVFWPWYLWREITMATVETSRLVNLSDGGHTGDNVGIYPLLQRRCKVIIACDAEKDPALTFGSFTEALRHAYVDMGIDIDIDLSLIRPDPVTGRSRSHSAVGRIRYPDRKDQESFLIYLKNSLTGDEPEPIQNYHSDRPEFPHESTADQFFDDAQFESYRALGVHLAEHTFAQWTISKWFPTVRDHHNPTSCQEPVA